MAENTKIEWTALRLSLAKLTTSLIETLLARGATIVGEELVVPGYTFNPWIGCAKVSPGCANCYAAQQDKFRHWTPEGWGKGKPRKRTSPANWKQVERWNREAGELGIRPRVFCASLADWLDDEVPVEWLADLLDLIRRTPHLDWLLLTKRPQNWRARMVAVCEIDGDSLAWSWLRGNAPTNVWIGTTAEDQPRVEERIFALLRIPARVRFLSCEPLLGPVDLGLMTYRGSVGRDLPGIVLTTTRRSLDWVICGGESGPGARPMHPDWARSLRDQCAAAGVAFFFKQWGNWTRTEARPAFCERADKLFAMSTDGSLRRSPDRVIGPGEIAMVRRATKKGRLLDGVEHNASPCA